MILKNLLSTTFRFFRKSKMYVLINVVGLSLGLAAYIMIQMYIQYEGNYDTFNNDFEKIFRVETSLEDGPWAASEGFIVPTLLSNFPEIETGTRFLPAINPPVFKYEEKVFRESSFGYIDENFFKVFTCEVVSGTLNDFSKVSTNVVVTESVAERYFGDEFPIGKVITNTNNSYTVVAVIRDFPADAHFHLKVMAPFSDILQRWQSLETVGFGALVTYSYIKLKDESLADVVRAKINDNLHVIYGVEKGEKMPRTLSLTPLGEIHLGSHKEREAEENNSGEVLDIFYAISILILIVAGINYINLATSKATTRLKEVGIRKIIGANKADIILQFFLESFLFTGVSLLIAIIVVIFAMPAFNELSEKEIPLSVLTSASVITNVILMLCAISMLVGLYPVSILSSVNISDFLKAKLSGKGGAYVLHFRRGVVFIQICISIFLVIGSFTIYRQFNYFLQKDPGFQKDHVVVVPVISASDSDMRGLIDGLTQQTGVVSVAVSSDYLGKRLTLERFKVHATGKAEPNDYMIRTIAADDNFLNTLKIPTKQGTAVVARGTGEQQDRFLVNETACKNLGISDPVGKKVEFKSMTGEIVGVIGDFNFSSMHSPIEPLLVYYNPKMFRYMYIRMEQGNLKNNLNRVKETWEKATPNLPFDYTFLDDSYDGLYNKENKLVSIMFYFTVLAILISALGLIALTSYIAEQRKKEIAVRKTLGASSGSIVTILSREFLLIAVLANVVTLFPVIYFVRNWLNNFAYSVSLNPLVFIGAAIGTVMFIVLLVSTVVVKYARESPVRYINEN